MKRLCMVCAVALCAGTVVLTAGRVPDPGQKGPYEVGFTNHIIFDGSRGWRPIPVYVWYPVDAGSIAPGTPLAGYPLIPLFPDWAISHSDYWEAYGIDRAYQGPPVSSDAPFPIVLFSPGWGYPPWLHTSIGTRLASHGYVVAIPYHFGDGWWGVEPFDHIAVAALNRPKDISFLLTDLLEKNETQGDPLEGAVNPDLVAAAGWSLGGYAAMTLVGGDDIVGDFFASDPDLEPVPVATFVPSDPDPRIKAIVTLDGSNQILQFQELERVDLPAMGIGQEWDAVGSWQARQHAAFTGKPSYRVDVLGSIHYTFCDACTGIPAIVDEGFLSPEEGQIWTGSYCSGTIPRDEVHRIVGQYMVSFLKANLEHRAGYQHVLTPGYALTHEPYVEFFVTEKRDPNSIDEDWPDDIIYFDHQPGSGKTEAEKAP